MLRLVQAGRGARRVVIFAFLVDHTMDAALRAALGPDVCIVADVTAANTDTLGALRDVRLPALLQAARAPRFEVLGVGLVGYSAGVSRVRALLWAGAAPLFVVTIDGTHASKPPVPQQISVWKTLAEKARAGAVLWVATHTYNTYVETDLRPPAGPYLATVSVLRAATGFALEHGGPPDAPLASPPEDAPEGQLHVYSYASRACDKAAHGAQETVALPWVLAKHVRPLLDGFAALPPDPSALVLPAWRDPARSLGERSVQWALPWVGRADLERLGPNASPEIARWIGPGIRRATGRPLKLVSGEWCAAFVCAAGVASLLDGEVLPHGYRVSGIELEQDADESGTWHPIAEVRAGTWEPGMGDVVSMLRTGGQAWERHVARFLRWIDRAAGSFETIGGNELNAVRVTPHKLSDPIRGFVAYPRAA